MPIDPPGLSALAAYGVPLLLGVVAGWTARTGLGLVGLVLGLVASHLVATSMGLVLLPAEGEVAVRIVAVTLFAALASLAYVAAAFARSRRERHERGVTPA